MCHESCNTLSNFLLSSELFLLPKQYQCIENPTGEVSLNVAVRGVPGPQGPQGLKGDIGPRGGKGLKGDRGVQGEKGERGDIRPIGPRALKGEKGIKGPKGSRGLQGIPGPAGSPGLVGSQGNRGSPGHEGPQGPIGPPGQPGHPGSRGPQGRPGDTVLTEKEFSLVTNSVRYSVLNNVNSTVTHRFDDLCKKVEKLNNSVLQAMQSRDQELLNIVMAELKVMNETLNAIKDHVKCGIIGNWRRIAYFDTTQGDSCPTGLRTVTNTTTHQKACGRTARRGCTSLHFSPDGYYTNVCGRVRGYQFGYPEAFEPDGTTIDSNYVDGISITKGNPRQHLWTYAAGLSENWGDHRYQCPCSTPDYDFSLIPSFVGNHYYCEAGLMSEVRKRYMWEDPLWDGNRCILSQNRCCERYGWFHRNVTSSSDSIEVRWCDDHSYIGDDTLTDQLEIWVM